MKRSVIRSPFSHIEAGADLRAPSGSLSTPTSVTARATAGSANPLFRPRVRYQPQANAVIAGVDSVLRREQRFVIFADYQDVCRPLLLSSR